MQHHTATSPHPGLLGRLWIDQPHHHRLVEVIWVVGDERVLLEPVRHSQLRPPSYVEFADQLAGLDYRRVTP